MVSTSTRGIFHVLFLHIIIGSVLYPWVNFTGIRTLNPGFRGSPLTHGYKEGGGHWTIQYELRNYSQQLQRRPISKCLLEGSVHRMTLCFFVCRSRSGSELLDHLVMLSNYSHNLQRRYITFVLWKFLPSNLPRVFQRFGLENHFRAGGFSD